MTKKYFSQITFVITTLFFAVLLNSKKAEAAIAVKGRSFYSSCGYYSQKVGQFEVTYSDLELPEGSQVQIIYGSQGTDYKVVNSVYGQNPVTWQNKTTAELKKSGDHSYRLKFDIVLNQRGSSFSYTGLDFTFKFILPDGTELVDNGSTHENSYYFSVLGNENTACEADAAFKDLTVQSTL